MPTLIVVCVATILQLRLAAGAFDRLFLGGSAPIGGGTVRTIAEPVVSGVPVAGAVGVLFQLAHRAVAIAHMLMTVNLNFLHGEASVFVSASYHNSHKVIILIVILEMVKILHT